MNLSSYLTRDRNRECAYVLVHAYAHKYLYIAHTQTYNISINTGKFGASSPRQDGKLKGAAVPLPPYQIGDSRKKKGRLTECRASPRNLILSRLKVVMFQHRKGMTR